MISRMTVKAFGDIVFTCTSAFGAMVSLQMALALWNFGAINKPCSYTLIILLLVVFRKGLIFSEQLKSKLDILKIYLK